MVVCAMWRVLLVVVAVSALAAPMAAVTIPRTAHTTGSTVSDLEVQPTEPLQVCVIGGGNWGTVVARHICMNIQAKAPPEVAKEVRMWTLQETVNGRNLTDMINHDRENAKYLPGYALPSSLSASSDLAQVCAGADIVCFVVPHQFAQRVLSDMRPFIKPDAIVVSLTKGIFFDPQGPRLLSAMIRDTLNATRVAVMLGANVASDVAAENFATSTLACLDDAAFCTLRDLFATESFRVERSTDVAGAEICGAIKNVIALGVGFCEGMGLGASTKAAVIAQGLEEVRRFNTLFNPTFQTQTLLQSCGLADVIASSFGGRNSLCAAEFARRRMLGQETDWITIETELLKGQKLQGVSTAAEVLACLAHRMDGDEQALHREFPLLARIHGIALEDAAPSSLFLW